VKVTSHLHLVPDEENEWSITSSPAVYFNGGDRALPFSSR
jgi:hypothetical protein